MPEYVRMVREDLLDRAWLPGNNRHETYPEAYRRWKDDQKAKGQLTGWI
jgi:hypothetical protein